MGRPGSARGRGSRTSARRPSGLGQQGQDRPLLPEHAAHEGVDPDEEPELRGVLAQAEVGDPGPCVVVSFMASVLTKARPGDVLWGPLGAAVTRSIIYP